MAAPLSNDLRLRVVRAIEGGLSRLAGQQLKCDLIRIGRSGNRLNYNVRNCSP